MKTRTYAFLLHDLLMNFCKKHAVLLQPDLRRNATRCTPIIADSAENFKCFLTASLSEACMPLNFSLDSISIVEFIIEARSNAKKDALQWKRT